MSERLLLVDEQDREIGVAGKLEAHRNGALHRAFSVLICDRQGQWLLQRRAPGKYHSAGLWANACCGHPRPGEATEAAALRRLEEELGFRCELKFVTKLIYRSKLDHDLIEHELVSLFVGRHDGSVEPDPEEADAIAWVEPLALAADLDSNPETYSVWLRRYVEELGVGFVEEPLTLSASPEQSGRDA
ncbi:MAG: isopentenyl-diphosphate Delta-isomerase [Geminicoccaceae bacterium]